MRIVWLTLLLAVTVLGQEKPAEKAQVPAQGPPPTNLTKFPDGHFSANAEPKNSENFDVHDVTMGETLSGISKDVLKDGSLWPQIWEQNEHIINPHWIYPKDKILIRPVTRISEATPPAPAAPEESAEATPAEEQAPAAPAERPRLVVSPALAPPPPQGPKSIFNLTPLRKFPEVKEADLFCAGFIRAESVSKDIKVVARYGGDEPVASDSDYIYLGKGLDDNVRPGTTYEVLRSTKSIDGLGTHYLEVAQVQIVIAQPSYALARVTQGCDVVEMGDFLVPYAKAEFPGELPEKRPFSGTMKGSGQAPGKVVTTKIVLLNSGSKFGNHKSTVPVRGSLAMLNRGVAAEGEVVYLNLGRDAGVKPGDLFIVFRDVPVHDGELRDNGQKVRAAIGEVVILKVEERASTALVTYSSDVIGQGDDVERR